MGFFLFQPHIVLLEQLFTRLDLPQSCNFGWEISVQISTEKSSDFSLLYILVILILRAKCHHVWWSIEHQREYHNLPQNRFWVEVPFLGATFIQDYYSIIEQTWAESTGGGGFPPKRFKPTPSQAPYNYKSETSQAYYKCYQKRV